MPYQIRAGSFTAIAANEEQALEMLRRMAASGKDEISIRDVFGVEIDAATLESRLKEND